VAIKARVVRHIGAKFRSAPLAQHIAYLEREGVTRDGARASMFDAGSETADAKAFAERCENDRHHFRFMVSPEDAGEMEDLRTFTRELMADAERDLGTRLDWVAVDHWNTDNPHIHVLVRGRADDGQDLVISRDYISRGFRSRAEERVSLELGPRTEREISAALQKEVEAERWTGLDRALRNFTDDGGGIADLRKTLEASNKLVTELSGIAATEGRQLSEITGKLDHAVSGLDSATIDSTIQNLKATSANAKTLTNNLASTTAHLDEVMAKVDTGGGSTGKLINDPALYNNVNMLLTRLDSLTADFKQHPKKYVRLSIF